MSQTEQRNQRSTAEKVLDLKMVVITLPKTLEAFATPKCKKIAHRRDFWPTVRPLPLATTDFQHADRIFSLKFQIIS
jgi:hypothetical protein